MTCARVEVLGLGITVEAPDGLLGAGVDDPARGNKADTGPHYLLRDVGSGRVDVERDGGGLRRAVLPEDAVATVLDDAVRAVVARRPGTVAVRGTALAADGRGVLVLGPGPRRRDLVAALDAGEADVLADDLVLIDQQGWIHPLGWGRHRVAPTAPVPLVLAVALEDDVDVDVEEVTGARAVLGVLREVVAPGATSPAARTLARRLAGWLVEVRGGADGPGAAELLDRARRLEVPQPGPGGPAGPEPEVSPPSSPPYLVFDDILEPAEHQALVDLALGHLDEFSPSGVHAADAGAAGDLHVDLRRSRSIYDLGEAWEPLRDRFLALLPHARRELDVPWFPLGDVEHHLTAHGEGDHFTRHVDNTTPDTSRRLVSAVYYFNRSPRRFTGGELRLFDTVERGGVVEPAGTHTDIEPRDNRLVVFRSDAHHEVRPVRLEGDDPGDRRFTVVLWARRAPLVESVFRGDVDTITARQHALIPSLTEDGFRVVSTPAAVQERLGRLLEEGRAVEEAPNPTFLPAGAPSIVPIGDLGPAVLAELQGLHEAWCGRPLVPSAAYGIRVYREGQTLRPHCDRVATHVISSIVHVADDIDEPWPLTVQDAGGRVHEVLLAPGQLLLYESAKLPHGRPTPLQGRSYASLFLHYRPVDWEHILDDVCRRAGESLVGRP